MVPRPSVTQVLARLEAQHPDAWTELHFRSPFELLAATILSAQCTDARVNQVAPALFARYPSVTALAQAAPEDLETIIQPTGFFRVKARNLIGMAAALVARHGGEVPNDMAQLVELPGVGRKTANVVRGHAFGLPGLPVDRHVLRVANRLGLVSSRNPEAIEAALASGLPPSRWTRASDTLILHGRRICKPKPLCDRCHVRTDCCYFTNLGPMTRRPDAAGGLRPAGRSRRASTRRRPAPGAARKRRGR